MPQFDLGPSNPYGIMSDFNTGRVFGQVRPRPNPSATMYPWGTVPTRTMGYEGDVLVPGRPKDKDKNKGRGRRGGGGGGGGGGAAGETAAQRAARLRRERAERRREERERRRAEAERRRNPLYRPFMTPKQLREEAERLALMSVASEDTLREEQRKQEAGLGALSGTLGGVLGGYQQQVTGGLAGLGSLYGDIAGRASTAGGEALAAAGVAPGEAPAVSPTVASQFANIGALTSGYVPAAVATGQRLIGESKASLTKALSDRATALSSNMAKFLRDLQRDEYERAIAQDTIAQNAQRLGISEAEAARRAETDAARLGLARERNQISWANLALRAENAANREREKAGNDEQKRRRAVSAAQANLVKNKARWLQGGKTGTGRFRWNIQFTSSKSGNLETVYDIEAATQEEAIEKAIASGLVTESGSPRAYNPREIMAPGTANINEVRQAWVNTLVAAGMKRANAVKWVNRTLAGARTPGSSNAPGSGAFFGGVGGSNL